MTYFELGQMIAQMTDAQKSQSVAVVDTNTRELYWVKKKLSTAVQADLDQAWKEGVHEEQVVIVV